MNNQLRWTKNVASLCAELSEEDGIVPRNKVHKKITRKQFQLCKEASRIFALVLAGETKQPLLRDLWVLSVEPDGNGQTLCVTLGYGAGDMSVTEACIESAISSVQGQLRSALAQAINRKRTPMLSFRYLGVSGKGEKSCLFKKS